MMVFVIIFSIVVVFGSFGHPGNWPPLNRWSFLMYTGFAVSIALELLAAWSQVNLSESNYAAGIAANVATARQNMHLADQSVMCSVAALFVFAFAVAIYLLKVRRTAA